MSLSHVIHTPHHLTTQQLITSPAEPVPEPLSQALVGAMADAADRSLQIKVSMPRQRPPIWRRVIVPAQFTLFDLHHVIQGLMGWEGGHLYSFARKNTREERTRPLAADGRFVLWDEDGMPIFPLGPTTPVDDKSITLEVAFATNPLLEYQYDGWSHTMIMEKAFPARQPHCHRSAPAQQQPAPWRVCAASVGSARLSGGALAWGRCHCP